MYAWYSLCDRRIWAYQLLSSRLYKAYSVSHSYILLHKKFCFIFIIQWIMGVPFHCWRSFTSQRQICLLRRHICRHWIYTMYINLKKNLCFVFILFVLYMVFVYADLMILMTWFNRSDEDDEPRCVQLTNQHKTAIRFIRKVNCFCCHFYRIFTFNSLQLKHLINSDINSWQW